MAGIIASKMQAQPEQESVGNITPGQPQPGKKVVGNNTSGKQEQAPDQGEASADPAVQDAYDRTMTAFMAAIYDDSTKGDIVASLQSEEPAKAIAMSVIGILAHLDQVAGGKIPSEALLQAAVEGMELIAELGERAGFYQFDEAVQAKTLQHMIAIAIERGIIEQSEIEALMAEMDPAEMQNMVAQQQKLAGGV